MLTSLVVIARIVSNPLSNVFQKQLALRSADLSVLGPINAYKAVLSLLLAVVLIGELPTLFGLIGVALIVAGSYLVIDRVPGQARSSAFRQFTREPGVLLRFAALVCSATE